MEPPSFRSGPGRARRQTANQRHPRARGPVTLPPRAILVVVCERSRPIRRFLRGWLEQLWLRHRVCRPNPPCRNILPYGCRLARPLSTVEGVVARSQVRFRPTAERLWPSAEVANAAREWSTLRALAFPGRTAAAPRLRGTNPVRMERTEHVPPDSQSTAPPPRGRDLGRGARVGKLAGDPARQPRDRTADDFAGCVDHRRDHRERFPWPRRVSELGRRSRPAALRRRKLDRTRRLHFQALLRTAS